MRQTYCCTLLPPPKLAPQTELEDCVPTIFFTTVIATGVVTAIDLFRSRFSQYPISLTQNIFISCVPGVVIII